MSLFQINWIQIAEIVVVLLVLFLISVELFKQISRWRYSLSNQALEIKNLKLKKIKDIQNISVKKINLITNSNSDKEIIRPTIIFLRSNFHRILPHILIEGLASYGFDVISVKLIIKSNNKNDIIDMELKHVLSQILNYLNQNNINNSQRYYLLSYSKSNFPYKPFIIDINNMGIILLNPKVNRKNIDNFTEILEYDKATKKKINVIFSKYSYLLLPNYHLKRFNRIFIDRTVHNNILEMNTIKKGRKSFKYYETILLGLVIQFLEKNIEKTQS